MKTPKALVVYYSRTNTTKQVGDEIASMMGADVEEIVSVDKRSGPIGYLKSGREASMKKPAKIGKTSKDPSGYDMVIIGTPVWAWNISSPVRTFLMEQMKGVKNTAFFCTQGGSGAEKAFKEMEGITGLKPQATLVLTTKEVKQGKTEAMVKEFVSKVKR